MKQPGKLILLLALSTAAGCSKPPEPVRTATAADDSAAVALAARSFLGAFDSLNWPGFTAHLSTTVDAYWPRADTADRLKDRAAVEERFRTFFDRIRAARPGPPYLHLAVQDMAVRVFGDVGLVTFELSDVPDTLGRRTVIFHRDPEGWRIVHLHASNLPLTAPAP